MSATLPNGIGEQQLTGTFSRQEWSVILTALHDAPMPLRLTAPIVNKLLVLVAPKVPAAKESIP